MKIDISNISEQSPLLIHGDCLEVMVGLPDGSVDMVLCDLPYGTTNCAWDSQIDLDRLWAQYWRVCKPSAAIVLFAQVPFDKVLGASCLGRLRYEWIWEKTAATGHLNANIAPMKAHENILVFYDRLPTFNPVKTEGHVRKTVARSAHGSEVYGDQVSTAYDSTERFPRDVIRFPKDQQKLALHPTQKPVALLEYLVRTYTDPGQVVLDNCMGSGSTGVACKIQGRKFIGIELLRKYFDIAADRIAGHFL